MASRCWLIQALADVGAFAEGIAIAEHTLRLAEADGHPYTLVLAYGRVGYLYLGKGEVHQAMPSFERGLELGYVWGIQQYRPWFHWGLGYALALSGRIPEGLTLLERTVGQARSVSLTNRNFLLCCRLLSSPLEYFFSLSMLWALYLIGPISLAASCGVGTHRLQRPSIRAGTNTRHPILYASFDGSRKACRRRPHLSIPLPITQS